MTQFRKMVEDQIQQVMQQPSKYKLLNDEIKKQVLEAVNKIEIDPSDLESYKYDSNPYETVWDEDEEWMRQIDRFIEYVEADGIIEYLPLPDDKMEDEEYCKQLQEEVIDWLRNIEPYNKWSYDEDLYRDR